MKTMGLCCKASPKALRALKAKTPSGNFVSKPETTDTRIQAWCRAAQKMRVPVGVFLGGIFLALMHPSARSLWLGSSIAILGASIRIWDAGCLTKGRILTMHGPYAYTRNPLYLGSFVMALGISIAGGEYWLLVPFALFYAAFYYPSMKAEEVELLAGHGQDFAAYASRVPFFIPRLRSVQRAAPGFTWSRVIQNGEHRNVFGLLLVWAFLWLRIVATSS